MTELKGGERYRNQRLINLVGYEKAAEVMGKEAEKERVRNNGR